MLENLTVAVPRTQRDRKLRDAKTPDEKRAMPVGGSFEECLELHRHKQKVLSYDHHKPDRR